MSLLPPLGSKTITITITITNNNNSVLSRCYDDSGQKNGKHGPMDPTKQEVYQFVEAFFEEITQVFPEKYLHLGGDEVDFKCW